MCKLIKSYFLQDVPLKNGLIMLPFFYACTVGINVFSILYSGAPRKRNDVNLHFAFSIS